MHDVPPWVHSRIAKLEAKNKRLLKEVFTAHENEAMSIRACDCLDCTAYRRGQG